ncbi:MAG: helix-turn-helix domain-containing protein [Rhodobiaceae bacterium]|nr:helix-turn-helix domain-containing protein [Rhodobiaceae bacterium]
MSEKIDNMESALARIGMTGKRARFYLASLQLGAASVQEIARHCGVTRTTAYSLVEKLSEEGVITLLQKGGRTHVVAEDPDVLLRNLDDRRSALSDVLPELRSIYVGGQNGPRFRLYEGMEGIRTVLNAVLTAQTDTLCGMLSMKELLQFPGREELARFVTKRVEAGKTLRVIRSASEDVDDIWGASESELREVRFTPTSAPLLMTTFVCDDQVAIISSKRENYGLIIESAGYANVQKTLFESLWAASQSL